VNPVDIIVSCNTDYPATFQVGGKHTSQVTLAELLATKDIIQPGTIVAPISFQVSDPQGQSAANLNFNFQKAGINVGYGSVQWFAQAIQLELALSYDKTTQKITYTIINTGKDKVNKEDNLSLTYQAPDGVELNGRNDGNLIIDNLKVDGSKTSQLDLNLGSKLSAEIIFAIMLNGKQVGGQQILKCEQENIKITFEDPSPLYIGGNPSDAIPVNLLIKNEGEDLAEKNKIIVQIKQQKGSTGKINNNKVELNELLQVEANAEIAGGTAVEAVNLVFKPKNKEELQFEVALYYKGQHTGSTKIINWKKSDVQLDLVITSGLELQGSNPMDISYQVQNKGTTQADPKKVRLQVKKIAGSKKVTIEGQILAVSGKKSFELPETVVLTANTTSNTLSLKLAPENGSRQTTFSLQLLYDGVQMGDIKKISWVPDVQLDFADASDLPIRVRANREKIYYHIVNQGLETATKKEIKLQLTNHSRDAIKLDSELVNPGKTRFIDGAVTGWGEIKGKESKKVSVYLRRFTNQVVDITLQLFYDGRPMGKPKKITWTKTPRFTMKASLAEPSSVDVQKMPIDLSIVLASMRRLPKAEVAKFVIVAELPSGTSLQLNDQDVVGKTLGDLGLAKELKKDDFIEANLVFTKQNDEEQVIRNLQLQDFTGDIVLGKIDTVKFPAINKDKK